MEDSLLLGDTLLFIATALIAFGVKVIETQFLYGIISLIVAAGIWVARAYLKKKAILEMKNTMVIKNTNENVG